MRPDEIRAGEGTLVRAAGMVAQAKGDFDRLSAVLSDNITAQQSRWQGQGGRAFFNLHQAWTEKQNRVVQALNEFEAALTSTDKLNVTTDTGEAQNMNKNLNRLGGV